MDIYPKILRAGDELVSSWLNAIRNLVIKAQLRTGDGSGISLTPTDHGVYIALANQVGGQLAITNGSITARSGTTAGTGSVYLISSSVNSAGTVCTLTNTASTPLTVFNFSGTTGGIPTGKYCWIMQDPSGTWFIVSAEC